MLDTRLSNYLPDVGKTQLELVRGFDAFRDFDDSRVDRISDPVRNVTHDSAEQLSKRVEVIALAGERGRRPHSAGHSSRRHVRIHADVLR